MSALKRLELIESIAVYLQSKFVTSDINAYLGGFGVIGNEESVASKRVYVKNLLATADNGLLTRIADDLGIFYPSSLNAKGENTAKPSQDEISELWIEGHFRLFLSHLSVDKERVTSLKKELERYGISSFVAHEDINPTTEWQIELEKALNSMDAIAALLSENFDLSKWTDQEIGWALGNGKVIIPLKRDLDPYGFMGKYQALKVKGKNADVVAKEIFEILKANPKTKNKALNSYKNSVVERFINAGSFYAANDAMDELETLKNLDEKDIKNINQALKENSQLIGATNVQNKIYDYLETYK